MVRFEVVLRSNWLASALLLLAVACADQDTIEKPMAPDMSEVVAAYNAPTAPLTQQAVATVVTTVQQRADLLRELGADGQILDALNTAGQSEENDSATQALTEPVRSIQQRELVFGDGFLRGVRICGGFGPEPEPNLDENGFILLLAGFTDTGFDSVVWGGFFNCKYRLNDLNIELKGQTDDTYGLYRAFIGEDVPFDEVGKGPTFFRFDLVGVVNGVANPLNFDFRVDPTTEIIETRINVEGGYVIPAVGTTVVGIRATNGNFGCNVEAGTCSNGTETLTF